MNPDTSSNADSGADTHIELAQPVSQEAYVSTVSWREASVLLDLEAPAHQGRPYVLGSWQIPLNQLLEAVTTGELKTAQRIIIMQPSKAPHQAEQAYKVLVALGVKAVFILQNPWQAITQAKLPLGNESTYTIEQWWQRAKGLSGWQQWVLGVLAVAVMITLLRNPKLLWGIVLGTLLVWLGVWQQDQLLDLVKQGLKTQKIKWVQWVLKKWLL
jgi:hypothetical protein